MTFDQEFLNKTVCMSTLYILTASNNEKTRYKGELSKDCRKK